MRFILLFLCLSLTQLSFATPIKFIAFGDGPFYYPPEDVSMFKKLIDQVNAEKPDFFTHVGDFRGGGADCSDSTFQNVKDLFNTIQAPVIFTPGDNDWTDCWAVAREPDNALASLRTHFFHDDQSLGQQKIKLQLQSAQQRFSKFTENRRWQIGDVAFFTVHIVGSKNNFPYKDRQGTERGNLEEFNERMTANLDWIENTFNWAKTIQAKAVVMIYHADMQYYLKPEERPGHEAIIQKLKQVVPLFSGEVLAVQGDSHKFIIDQPITEMTPWNFEWPIKNFTRLQVYGSPDIRGVKITIDTTKAQPFQIEPLPQIRWEYALPTK